MSFAKLQNIPIYILSVEMRQFHAATSCATFERKRIPPLLPRRLIKLFAKEGALPVFNPFALPSPSLAHMG